MSKATGVYDREIDRADVDAVLDRIASGMSLEAACRVKGAPSASSVFRYWERHPESRASYEAAKRERALLLAERALEVAQGLHRAEGKDEAGAVARDKLDVDTHKWFLARIDGKNWGDKTIHAGDPDQPLIPPSDPDTTARRIAFLLAQGLAAKPDDPSQ